MDEIPVRMEQLVLGEADLLLAIGADPGADLGSQPMADGEHEQQHDGDQAEAGDGRLQAVHNGGVGCVCVMAGVLVCLI